MQMRESLGPGISQTGPAIVFVSHSYVVKMQLVPGGAQHEMVMSVSETSSKHLHGSPYVYVRTYVYNEVVSRRKS